MKYYFSLHIKLDVVFAKRQDVKKTIAVDTVKAVHVAVLLC
jgi:hypothetical protein